MHLVSGVISRRFGMLHQRSSAAFVCVIALVYKCRVAKCEIKEREYSVDGHVLRQWLTGPLTHTHIQWKHLSHYESSLSAANDLFLNLFLGV